MFFDDLLAMTSSKAILTLNSVVVLACRVFQSHLERIMPKEFAQRVAFLDYGLHQDPRKLRTEIQRMIREINHPSLVILGYGLCGNGLDGIEAGIHTLLVPRTDDCIAILLGSYLSYRALFQEDPGTYYLTSGWLESGSNPLQEYRGYVEKYGREKADLIMDLQYQHYHRLIFIAQNPAELERYREQIKDISNFCQRWNMKYEYRMGSGQYIERLFHWVPALINGEFNHNEEGFRDEFVMIQPGEKLEQKHFLRIKSYDSF